MCQLLMLNVVFHKFPPQCLRLEQITILNLKGLSRSLFTSKMYHTLQQVNSAADVFPGMLHSVIIVNAPGFFSFFWSAISRLLDAKTQSLIEIYSSPEKGRERLLELIDEKELPRDYGGEGPSTAEIILREGRDTERGVPHRQIVELLSLGGKDHSFELTLHDDEQVEFAIYTRSTAPYDFTLNQIEGKENNSNGGGDDDDDGALHKQNIHATGKLPARFDFGTNAFKGPGKFAMTTHAKDRHSSGKQYFLLIGEVFRV